MSLFCSNCGNPLTQDARFCDNCGAKVEQKAAPAVSVAPEVMGAEQAAAEIHTEPAADAPKADAPKADAPKTDAPKTDAPKADAPKADAPKAVQAPQAGIQPAEKKKKNKTVMIVVIIAAVMLLLLLIGGGILALVLLSNAGIIGGADPVVSAADEVAGYYIMDGDDGAVILREDGTGYAMEEDEAIEIRYEEGFLYMDGESFVCTVDETGLTILSDEGSLVFHRSDDPYPKLPDEVVYRQPNTDAAQWNEMQARWNGTWYGTLVVTEAEGAYEGWVGSCNDCYIIIDVDAMGEGVCVGYIDGFEVPLFTLEGRIMLPGKYINNEWFHAQEGWIADCAVVEDELVGGSYIEGEEGGYVKMLFPYRKEDGSSMRLELVLVPYGEDWLVPAADGHAGPVNYEEYLEKILNHEEDPFYNAGLLLPEED